MKGVIPVQRQQFDGVVVELVVPGNEYYQYEVLCYCANARKGQPNAYKELRYANRSDPYDYVVQRRQPVFVRRPRNLV